MIYWQVLVFRWLDFMRITEGSFSGYLSATGKQFKNKIMKGQ